MKNRLLFIISTLFLLFLHPPDTDAKEEILIVQSSKIKPYMEALQGLRTTLASIPRISGLKTVEPYPVTERLLSGEWTARFLRDEIKADKPAMIIAIGTNALAAVKVFTDIPIIYLMVPYPDDMIKENRNITGVNMQIPPELQLDKIIESLPETKRIGLVYDPERSGDTVEKIKKRAVEKGIFLIASKTRKPSEVPIMINAQAGNIDAFWMLPDLTVITPETTEHILFFSLENHVPIITFSEKYLKLGAAVAVTFDIAAMGEQAGDLARKIISGTEVQRIQRMNASKMKVMVNEKVVNKLGIKIKVME